VFPTPYPIWPLNIVPLRLFGLFYFQRMFLNYDDRSYTWQSLELINDINILLYYSTLVYA